MVSALAGLGLGILTALGLEALLKGFGVTLPAGSLVFEARTAVVGLLVGVGVTVVSAISPARRAVRIPAVAALSDYHNSEEDLCDAAFLQVVVRTGRNHGVVRRPGGPCHPARWLGAVSSFVGVGMLSPIVARPLGRALGRPLAAAGISGRLGRENSMRSPRRMAQTSSALMVGFALVSAIAVFGASLASRLPRA